MANQRIRRKVFKTIYRETDQFTYELEVDEDYDCICVIIEGARCPQLKEHGWVKNVIQQYRELEEIFEDPAVSDQCGHDQYQDLNVA